MWLLGFKFSWRKMERQHKAELHGDKCFWPMMEEQFKALVM